MKRAHMLLVTSLSVVATLAACAQTPPPQRTTKSFDPALVREQQRRIAAYDSVVRTVNTDSLYRLWQAMLTTPDIRATQLLVQCEQAHLSYRYGRASYDAIQKMRDTLWKHADPALVARIGPRMAGEGPAMGRDTCGPRPPIRAPRWLRQWTVYELPELPPSPDDTTTADP